MVLLARPANCSQVLGVPRAFAAWSIIVGILMVILSFKARSFGKTLVEAGGQAS